MGLNAILKGEFNFPARGSGVMCCHTRLNKPPSEYSCCQEASHLCSNQVYHQMGCTRHRWYLTGVGFQHSSAIARVDCINVPWNQQKWEVEGKNGCEVSWNLTTPETLSFYNTPNKGLKGFSVWRKGVLHAPTTAINCCFSWKLV